jgi:fumarate reductase iron-sulfur subunit
MMKKKTKKNDINRIEKRAIEALAIAPVIKALSQKIGNDEVLVILKEVNQQEAFQRGQNIIRTKGLNDIEELVNDVVTWGEGGVWEMEVLEQTSTTYFFNVFRCPYYEKYKEIGLDEFGVEFSCCRDEPFAKGISSKLSLKRTKTIMEGADFCDFRYYLESK